MKASSLALALSFFGMVMAHGSNVCRAALVVWEIDSSQSSITLNIPQQTVPIGSSTVPARVVNQTGFGASTWTVGRTAPISGEIVTNYVDGTSIEFLGGSHNVFGLTTGNYVPNPADWNPTAEEFNPDDGQALAVFAGRIQVRPVPFPPIFITVAYFSIRDVVYDLDSPNLPVDGSGNFAGGGTAFGIENAQFSLVGGGFGSESIPSALQTLSNLGGANNGSLTGTITSPAMDLRELTIPINVSTELDLDGVILTASITGQIVATTVVVPEPASVVMMSMGLLVCATIAVRRRRRA